MRLKKIRLAGFKSFVDPTNIPFPGDMTAVVGPNGCGKSNVIDAVRWVLGESSAKNLRGDSMTDVIFNGSTARKSVSQCSVELVFDNSSGRIQGEFAAFNEISVKRIVTKDAVSSYWLNNAKCRRRDITDLFLGTGLGPRSYAIIEQGMISKLIESKPQDLRVFIEEAAGISKYKERRKETLNRISHTKDNLERLDDVRNELGDQIAKLKRQATAANRYKELKEQERRLKAELATIKWLAQSKIMASIQDEIAEKQQTLDSLVSSQQGDESGLQALKNEQAILKQEIDDMQQTVFSVGTEITKLEQSQLFSKKRLIQIQSEVQQLKLSETELQQQLDKIHLELNQAEQKLLDGEPQKELLEEQLFEIENRKYEVDDKLQSFLRSRKTDDDAYHNKKQLLQQKHSQIQQSLSLQQRLTSRVNTLQLELQDISSPQLNEQSKQNEALIEQCDKRIKLLGHDLKLASVAYTEQQTLLTRAKEKLDAQKEKLLGSQLRLQALQELQQSNADLEQFTQHLGDVKWHTVWQYFNVMPGYERVLHSALKDMEGGLVLEAQLLEHLNSTSSNTPGLMFSHNFTTNKTPNTLASKLLNTHVPAFTNNVLVVDNLDDGLAILSDVMAHQKVICKSGEVLSDCSFISDNTGDNKVLRNAQIKHLTDVISELRPTVDNCDCEHTELAEHLAELAMQNKQKTELLQDAEREAQNLHMQQKNLHFQIQQFAQRTEKLTQEIEDQQTELAQEEMSLELLNENVEDLSIEVAELEELRSSTEQHSESLQQQQQTIQIQYNASQTKLHEHAMLQQQLQNSLTILQEQSRNKSITLSDNLEKLALLQEEAEDLLMPEQQQEEKLEKLLAEQEEIKAQLVVKREMLAQVESDISDLEKGAHGLVTKMDGIKSQIESLRIQSESANVRAQSHIEQLAELSQSVKDILESLDEQAEEKTWQQELDQVIASLGRLGAVNLAAVDEYEEQFERKQHLDNQNDDLTQALDTLETAMRKIDKETRTRFKLTFDQVNGDRETLFPKVFGGGSAYLDLTGEDLLETGVTIMARPPGKKNSTIHLLSGGEKALTALSLVFAIFRLNPAPFCLLDEVDAPLDDANVGRFCRLVSEMSKTVQFIYITHNKVAMEMATHLTGVTMAEPGVSRMVAVDMEEALAIAE